MWVFGHLGFGSKIAEPFTKRLPFRCLLLGTITPDLIDKPLYYGAAFITGRTGSDIGLISCTRTFGHSAIFALLVTFAALVKKSKPLAALAVGIATHLLLDGFEDYWIHRLMHGAGESSSKVALLFPFYMHRFSAQPFSNFAEHFRSGGSPFLLATEAIGFLLLAATLLKGKRRFRLADRIGLLSRKSKADR